MISDEQIEKWKPMAAKVSRRYASLGGFGFEFEDRMQVALMGVTRALEEFDPSWGSSLKTFVHNHAKWAILNESRTYCLKTRKSGRSEAMVDREYAIRSARSIDAQFGDGDFGETISDPDDFEPTESWDDLAGSAKLTKGEARALWLRVGLDLNLREVGEDLGVSRERARQLANQAIAKVRQAHPRSALSA